MIHINFPMEFVIAYNIHFKHDCPGIQNTKSVNYKGLETTLI